MFITVGTKCTNSLFMFWSINKRTHKVQKKDNRIISPIAEILAANPAYFVDLAVVLKSGCTTESSRDCF